MYGNYNYGYGGWNRGMYAPQMQPSQAQFSGYQAPQQFQDSPPPSKPSLQVPWVNGEVGAQAYLVAPNTAVLLMDSDNPIFYIKTSDQSGKAIIQAFKYEEISVSPQQKKETTYVTREEFETFKKSLMNKGEEEQKI